jgi:hypothetical protein
MASRLAQRGGKHGLQIEGFKAGHGTGNGTSRMREMESCRQLNDKHSWVMDLDTTDITPSTTPNILLASARFSMSSSVKDSFGTIGYLSIDYY